ARLLAVNPVLLRACATNPTGRYRSASELARDLAALEVGRKPRRRRKAWMLPLVMLALLCGIAAVSWFLRGAPHRDAVYDLRIETDPAGALVLLGDRMEKSPAHFDSIQPEN